MAMETSVVKERPGAKVVARRTIDLQESLEATKTSVVQERLGAKRTNVMQENLVVWRAC